jgi:hypothetical protein
MPQAAGILAQGLVKRWVVWRRDATFARFQACGNSGKTNLRAKRILEAKMRLWVVPIKAIEVETI